MTALLRSVLLLFFCVCIPVSSQAAPQEQPAKAPVTAVKRPKTVPVTIVLPAAALHQTLSSLLPLPIEQLEAAGKRFQGSITIDSINNLNIDNGQIFLAGQLSGRDLSMNASVGSQNIHIRLGSLTLPVICDVALRFDPARQLLLLTPVFKRASTGNNQAEEGLLALLNSLSKEYQLPLRNVLRLTGRFSPDISLQMKPLNIRAENGAVTIWLKPIAKKRPR